MVLILVTCIHVSAFTYAQQVTLQKQGASLEEIINEIHAQTGYDFVYSSEKIGRIKTDIDVRNATISDALALLFKGLPFTYDIVKTNVLIKEKNPAVLAQPMPKQASVGGKVTDSDGNPLAGANIQVKGTNVKTVADGEGAFMIKLTTGENAVIVASYVGFQTQEVAVGRQTDILIQLKSASELDEIVVVGYGRVSKADLTGAVSVISNKAVTSRPALRVDEMLQGKAAGMMVTAANGAPGASSNIRIRGNNSITASSEPLYVIDGLLGVGDLGTINPSDIQDITVLKDASATAIYGSRGANGVILITTKKGIIGDTRVTADVQRGYQWLPRKLDLLTGSEYAVLLNESRVAAGGTPVYENPENVKTTDWQEEIMQTASLDNVNVAISGGSDKMTYYLSGNYFNQEGIIQRSGVERLQIRANLESELSDQFKLGANINAGRILTTNNTVPMAPSYNILTTAPSMPVYNDDGSYYHTYPHPAFNGSFDTPVASQNLIKSIGQRGNLTMNAFAEYTPLSWLTIKSTFGGQLLGYGRSNSYTDSRLPAQTTNQQFGRASISYNDGITFQNENTVNVTKTFGSNHFIDGVAGFTYQSGSTENMNADAHGFKSDASMWYNLAAGNPATRNIGSGYQNWNMLSYLARLTYRYKSRYLITLTGREDGSSRLAKGNQWAFFPSAAVGWVVSEEPFLKDEAWLNHLKLRASYGKVGNQAVDIYQTLSTFAASSSVLDGTQVNAWAPGQVGNEQLQWETKNQWDVGLEFSLLDDRLGFVMDYYSAKTDDLLLLIEIPAQTGYTQRMDNVGSVGNHGLEATVNAVNIKQGAFTWTTQLTLGYNQNKVLKLGPTGADIITHTYTWGVRPIGILREGEPIGSFYGYLADGIWKENQDTNSIMPGALAGSIKYKDVDGNGLITQADNVILGNGNPNWYGGLSNHFTYKNFGLDIYLSGAQGSKIFNANAPFLRSTDAQFNHYREILDRWDPELNPDSNVPGTLNGDREINPSDRWVFDASYIRLESVNFSYRWPIKNNPVMKGVTLVLSGSNLFMLSPYKKWGYDPVINQKGGSDLGYNNSLMGYDYGAYPRSASFTAGLNVTF